MRPPLVVLVIIVGALLTGRCFAQTFTVLHNFAGSDGRGPTAALIISSNTIYGTTFSGGTRGYGTVFRIESDGTCFTNLHSFNRADGASPNCRLLLVGNTLYGTTLNGGPVGYGNIFALGIDGTGFTNLHSFNGTDGWEPYGALAVSSNRLYGTTSTTSLAAPSNGGTVFAVNTDGTGFTNLHNFNYEESPFSGLLLWSNILYGTTSGGDIGNGTVFALNTDGSGFTNLHNFNGTSDGAHPQCDLILSGNTLYGTAPLGGNRYGTVFAINMDGTNFRTLYTFTGGFDGGWPNSGLASLGDNLYGVGSEGNGGNGTVFALTSDGTEFSTLHDFSGFNPPIYLNSTNVGGANPYGALAVSGFQLYGTCEEGGFFGDNGTIFSISLLPQLTISAASENFVLSWPTSYAGFDYSGFTLQSTTNLASSVWTTNLPAPVINGQFSVTNPISGAQQFFRLSQ